MSRLVITIRRPVPTVDDFHVVMTDGFVLNTTRFRNYFAALDAATVLQKELAPARLVDLVGGADANAS